MLRIQASELFEVYALTFIRLWAVTKQAFSSHFRHCEPSVRALAIVILKYLLNYPLQSSCLCHLCQLHLPFHQVGLSIQVRAKLIRSLVPTNYI